MSVESGVLVIHCSDPRYQDVFHEFLSRDLGLKRYALLAVPGGAQFLTAFEYLPKFGWAGWRWVKFLDKLGNTDRVVIIAHDDCRWYHDMGIGLQMPVLEKQTEDMRRVAAELRERFGTSSVELYYARLHDKGAVIQPL